MMTVDTGAAGGVLPTTFVDTSLLAGEAVEGPSEKFSLADGSTGTERTVTVHVLTIGNHTLHDVKFSVVPDNGMRLLGFDTLSAIGAFKIDPARSVLTFG
jgi:hypothetical protein